MIEQRSVIHDTFTIERTYEAEPERVFAAFTSAEAKSAWGGGTDLEVVDPAASEFDFVVGGRERFTIQFEGTTLRYDALYYDIVPDRRIIYSYEMYANDVRISVSVATIQITPAAGGARLVYTEQGAFLDGIDGTEAPRLREGGTAEMLDGLGSYLQMQD